MTAGRALAQQRRNHKKFLDRQIRALAADINYVVGRHFRRMAEWISQDASRYQKRAGGLGRKRK